MTQTGELACTMRSTGRRARNQRLAYAHANETILRREYAAAGEEPLEAAPGIPVSRELFRQLSETTMRTWLGPSGSAGGLTALQQSAMQQRPRNEAVRRN